MKNVKLTLPILALTILFCLSSCIRNNEIIRGNGVVTEDVRSVSTFNSLDVSGSFKVLFSISDTFSLQVSAESNLLPLIQTSVKNNRLSIKNQPGFSLLENQPMIIRISAPSIIEINLSGSSNFLCNEIIETNNFKAHLSGSCKIETGLIANQSDSNISGSGSIKITDGESQVSKYNISGSATIEARDHNTQKADIKISGSGKVWLNVTNHMEVKISGSGEVNYLGDPTIASSISGSGRINKL